MKVYVVLQIIDLGDGIFSIHRKKKDADILCEDLNKDYQARLCVDREYFHVEEHEVM
jgi:hypothetical protein